MAISNSASGFRPGVCTSTTRPQAPYNGQVIYETDTKRTLVWEGSAWVMLTDADQPPGLQLVKTQTIGTGVSSVTVTDAFSADYDSYRVVYDGGVASQSLTLTVTLGLSSSGYNMSLPYVTYGVGVASGTSLASASAWALAGYGTTDYVGFQFDLFSPFLARHTRLAGFYVGENEAGAYVGIHKVASSYTSFAVTTSAGTITGGTICVYGYRN